MKIEIFQSDEDGSGLRIGVVQSRWNSKVVQKLWGPCQQELLRLGVEQHNIFACAVPGAFEIPIVVQQLASAGTFDAIVALGSVIRGETSHFELVAHESAAAISRLALEWDVPIINAILATDDEQQALARVNQRGVEAAAAAVEMGNLMLAVSSLCEKDDDDDDDDDDDEEDEEIKKTSSLRPPSGSRSRGSGGH